MQIVVINVSRQIAPIPSQLQEIGSFISMGGTTLTVGTKQILRSSSDLADIIQTSHAISSMTWLANVLTVNTTAPHGIPVGDTVSVTIAGATPSGYNGTYEATATDSDTFTAALGSNPGSNTIPGTYILGAVSELTRMNTTFWSQGRQQPVYVLELGPGDAATGTAALTTYIAANLNTIYSFLVPADWSADASMLTLANLYSDDDAMTYFWLTGTTGDMQDYEGVKSVFYLVPSPDAAATEFQCAAPFWKGLSYRPAETNKVTPFIYSYMLGVTPWSPSDDLSTLDDILNTKANYIGSGAEGGISNKVLRNGTMMDGKAFNYWYSIDWAITNVRLNLTNAVMNGSNNAQNPLYYNQDGINRLQGVISNTIQRGVSFGMVFGAPLQLALEPSTFTANYDNSEYAGLSPINAQPFITYSAANPDDFGNGLYSGFQFAITPNQGFTQIFISMNVSDFVTG